MKAIVTGRDSDGRSRVVSEVDLSTTPDREIWAAPAEWPVIGLLESLGEVDLGVPPGGLKWLLVRFRPNQEGAMHWTRTVDLDTVLAGSVELLLDDGAVELGPGDCAVVTGVRHGWRSGPDGSLLAAAVVGVVG